MDQCHPHHLAEHGKGVSSTEGNPGEPGGAGVGGGQSRGCCKGDWSGLARDRLGAVKEQGAERNV